LSHHYSHRGERRAWLQIVTEDLWQGRVELVIEACQQLSKKSNLAKQALTYYDNNLERTECVNDLGQLISKISVD